MTVKLRRLWLDSIGDPAARFSEVLIDFTDAHQTPLDTIVWLRNGGGKTSLLALTFSLVLPAQRDFLGGSDQERSLADYVQTGDTSHVVAEWDTAHGTVITGAVYEWPDRRRPAEPSKHQSELVRRWYIGRPSAGFAIGELPARDTAGRVRLEQYVASLRAMSRQRPGAVSLAATHTDWRRALEEFGIDQAVFRYQKSMNRGEGSIDELFRFPTPEQFVDFLIDLVVDVDEPNSFATRLRAVAAKVAARPKLQLERDFCAGASDRLIPVVSAWNSHQHAEMRLAGLSQRAWMLQTQLATAADAASINADELRAERSVLGEERTRLGRAYRAAQQRSADARSIHADLWVREATALLEHADESISAAERELDHWQLLDRWLDLVAIDEQIAAVDELLAARTEGAEPLRLVRNRAAAALLARYSTYTTDLAARTSEVGQRRTQADGRATAAEQEAEGWDREQREASLAVQRARDELDRIDKAVDEAVSRGDVAAHDDPIAAHTAACSRDGELAAEDVRLEERSQRVENALAAMNDERQQLAITRAEADADARRDDDRADQIAAVVGRFATHERVREMAQTDDVSVWAAGDAIIRRLADAVSTAGSELVTLGIAQQRDTRNRHALGDAGLLPPSDDVDAILGVLAAAAVPATSGLAFLSQSIKRQRWEDTITAHPGLLSGVLVDDDQFDRARAAAIEAGLHPASLVAIGRKRQVLDVAGEGAFVVPPSLALFDQRAAAQERTRLDRSLADHETRRLVLEAQQRTDGQLRVELEQFLEHHPAGSLEAVRQAAAAANGHVRQCDERLASIEAERTQHEADRGRVARRRREITEERRTLSAAIERLQHVVTAVARRPNAEEELAEARSAEQVAAQARGAAREHQAVAARESASASNELRELDQQRSTLRERQSAVTFVGDPVEVGDVGSEITEALARSFELAHRAYQDEVNDVGLTSRREHLVTSRGRVARQLPSDGDERLVGARRLLDNPDASSPESRSRRRDRLTGHLRDLIGERALADADLKSARSDATAQGDRSGAIPDAEVPATRDEAVALVTATEHAAAKIRTEEIEMDRRIDTLDAEIGTLTTRASTMSLLRDGLENLVGPAPALALTANAYAGDDDVAKAEVDELQSELRESKARAGRTRNELDSAGSSLRQFCTRAEYAPLAGVADGAVLAEVDALAPRAEALAGQLRDRVVVLDSELASVDADRQILITDLLGQVQSILDLLNRAGRTLILPDGLDAWAGLSFLSITFQRPDEDTELRHLLADEVDRIVAAGNVPEGLTCLKRSVHAAVPKGFRVTVLKPSAELVTQRHPITRMGGWSGGEKLTAAVLLYCTLARLRASRRRQTLTDVGAGVLVLDNPLGKASYVGFVALQRRVAALLGVQLVYTTAVRDLGAVGKFPNVVRCRNVAVPERGRSFVGVVAREGAAHGIEVTGTVSAARVVRDDSTNGEGSVADDPEMEAVR